MLKKATDPPPPNFLPLDTPGLEDLVQSPARLAFNFRVNAMENDDGEPMFISFEDAAKLIDKITEIVQGVDNVLSDIEEYTDESCDVKNALCRVGLQNVINELKRVTPEFCRLGPGGCNTPRGGIVHLVDIIEDQLKEVKKQEQHISDLKDHFQDLCAEQRLLLTKISDIAKKNIELEAELRTLRKKKQNLQQEAALTHSGYTEEGEISSEAEAVK